MQGTKEEGIGKTATRARTVATPKHRQKGLVLGWVGTQGFVCLKWEMQPLSKEGILE